MGKLTVEFLPIPEPQIKLMKDLEAMRQEIYRAMYLPMPRELTNPDKRMHIRTMKLLEEIRLQKGKPMPGNPTKRKSS
ncbi:hypothetical protein [uncultured Nitratireductor sp.]|uniref:hypothetical protein n=1 Tax=uncultured Nitratireductor sp. TaxID=520953 RepID=UPI0025CC1B4D|nr:hypothetical protein [uncultured Nitratireductor sp.]